MIAARRVRQHVMLGVLTIAGLMLAFAVIPSTDGLFRASMATAYVSLTLLVVSLAIGPVNVIRGRPNPVSTNLRRDVSIWGGSVGLLHVLVGLQVHLHGRMLEYFFARGPSKALSLRHDAFGVANHGGLVAGLVLLLLLTLSNDVSLRRLGTRRWKNLQRANYVGMALIVGHGILYQLIEKRQRSFVMLFALEVVVATMLQFRGYRAIRSRRAARAVTPAIES